MNENGNPWTNWKSQDQWQIRGKSADAVWTDEWATQILHGETVSNRLKKIALDDLFTPTP
jgi:hypothetical protein